MTPGRSAARADRARLAGERAESAGQRAAALQIRLEALSAGQGSTASTLGKARAARAQSVLDAEQARQAAMSAYVLAAEAHRSAAALARFVGDSERAQKHLDLALADDASAAALAVPQV